MALHRNLAQSLVEHGQITTTLPKARDVRPFFERLITLAVKVRKATRARDAGQALSARRKIYRLLGDRSLIPSEHQATYEGMSDARRAKTLRMASGRRHRTGEPQGRLVFTGESVTHRLIETIAPRYEDRPGGYTRLVQLGKCRIGDCSPLAMVQLVGDEQAPGALTRPSGSARKRRADARYGLAIKLAKTWGTGADASRKVDRAAEDGESDAEGAPEESVGSGE